jgi:pimeloyl-ACP methyl ester carboxylesterase/predicted glycosyltransferase
VHGSLERGGGVSIAWQSLGDGTPPVLLLPTWSIVTSRTWKLQVPYLARHHRVITFDGRGSGASSKPSRAEDYSDEAFVGDALAVLDAAGVESALVVGLSSGGRWGIQLAGRAPERVLGLVLLAPTVGLVSAHDGRVGFEDVPDPIDGWTHFTRHAWRTDYPGFLEFFFGEMFCEPHSTRPIEESVGWGREIGAPALELTYDAWATFTRAAMVDDCRAVGRPTLILHGDEDRIVPHANGEAVAELTGGTLVTFAGAGHGVHARHPVKTNELIHATAQRLDGALPAPGRWQRALARPKRALYVSSPIGLGHARRDLAIARALRERAPGLEIDWLAQEPTSRALEAAGERVHPASRQLWSEVEHIDAWSGDHTLRAFESIRHMDEILTANYMLFRDVARAEPYDLWIGDEAWELDHYLHENPEDKIAPFAWLTDFVGWLPLPEYGEREAELAADYNAEMIEHVARFPWIRDRSLFVGDPEDVVPDDFGPGLGSIADWTRAHFTFTGQIVDPPPAEREPSGDGPLCIVTAGGSGAGATLLVRAVAALSLLRERVPGLRMLVVAGPRVDRSAFGEAEGLEVVGYLPDLSARLAACDVALVHGGMSTGMELVAAGRPFVSVPLRGHFEQLGHVRYRLERHGHRRIVEAGDATPERLADELAAALADPPGYLPVAETGAARAAELIAELL